MRHTLYILFIIISSFSLAQEDNNKWVVTDSFKLEYSFLEIDQLGQLYLINETSIIKLDENLDTIAENSNLFLGQISQVDVSNPLKTLVFFKESSQLIVLDNKLASQREALDLIDFGLEFSTLVATSVNNAFWAFDYGNMELVRLSENGIKLVETGNLSQTLGVEEEPTFLSEKDNQIYLYFPSTGILVFDFFGSFVRKIPITKIKRIQKLQNGYLYLNDDGLFFYNDKTFQSSKFQLPVKQSINDFAFHPNFLVIACPNDAYKLKLKQ